MGEEQEEADKDSTDWSMAHFAPVDRGKLEAILMVLGVVPCLPVDSRKDGSDSNGARGSASPDEARSKSFGSLMGADF